MDRQEKIDNNINTYLFLMHPISYIVHMFVDPRKHQCIYCRIWRSEHHIKLHDDWMYE